MSRVWNSSCFLLTPMVLHHPCRKLTISAGPFATSAATAPALPAQRAQRWPPPALMFTQCSPAPDEDLVVAAVVAVVGLAFERAHCIRQQRQAGLAAQHSLPNPFLALGARELVGQLLLTFAQHVDRIASGLLPGRETVGFAPDAKQDERRVERQRIERTDCHTEPIAARRHGCDNGDAGRKLAERVTETSRVQHGFPPVKFARRPCYEGPIANSRNKPCSPSSVFQAAEPIAPNFYRKR